MIEKSLQCVVQFREGRGSAHEFAENCWFHGRTATAGSQSSLLLALLAAYDAGKQGRICACWLSSSTCPKHVAFSQQCYAGVAATAVTAPTPMWWQQVRGWESQEPNFGLEVALQHQITEPSQAQDRKYVEAASVCRSPGRPHNREQQVTAWIPQSAVGLKALLDRSQTMVNFNSKPSSLNFQSLLSPGSCR